MIGLSVMVCLLIRFLLIKLLDIKGALLTIDVMACQTKIEKTIVKQGGDYLLAVEHNQGTWRKAIEGTFSGQHATKPQNAQFEKGHGHIESRKCYVIDRKELGEDFSR